MKKQLLKCIEIGKDLFMKLNKDLSVAALDKRLWDVFSLYVRLRDTNKDGYGQCITSGAWRHYTSFDCGHGIGRQHFCTKYDEKNNHCQSKRENGFEEGNKSIYSKKVDNLYGDGTWAELEQRSKGSCKKVKFYFLEKIPEYQEKIRELMKSKNFELAKNYHTRLNWK